MMNKNDGFDKNGKESVVLDSASANVNMAVDSILSADLSSASTDSKDGSGGFLYHYDTLQQIVEELSDAQQPDLDKLIPLVDKAMASYAEIQKRVSAVQKLLDSRKDQFK